MNNKFQQTGPVVQPVPTPAYSDKQFLHKVESAVILPLWQAVITSIFGMLGAGVVLYLFDAIDYVKPILVTGAVVLVLTWLYLQRRWLNLTMLETHLRMDINGDGVVGKKTEKKETVVWINEQKDNTHFSSDRKSLPIDDEELVMLADGLINRGRRFSRREWTPKEKGFSDTDWRALQADCIKFHLVEKVGTNFELTRAGRALMKHYATLSPTPVMDEVEA